MKYFLITLAIAILFGGCTTRNAFAELNINEDQEKAIENTKSWKIISPDKVEGVFSAVYLNNVYEDSHESTNKFYISMYLKTQNKNFSVTLNNQAPQEIAALPNNNKYRKLLSIENGWRSDYLVTFKNDENNNSNQIILKIDSGPFSSGPLSYLKDQR